MMCARSVSEIISRIALARASGSPGGTSRPVTPSFTISGIPPTAVGGIPEIVKDGVTGRLVPPGEPDALARAILEMISDTERAHIMAQAGQALVRERFTVDAM